MGQRGFAHNRGAQAFPDAFLSAGCSHRDTNSPSDSIFCPGLAVARPAQPAAAALMGKLLVLFWQRGV